MPAVIAYSQSLQRMMTTGQSLAVYLILPVILKKEIWNISDFHQEVLKWVAMKKYCV
jgi:hypothetical protein